MKISIITPTLNHAEFIRDTIESILSQNYSDYEHIIIDGGSKDSTIDIVKEYSHLRWISEKDKGPANAINKGMKIANGEIVTWLNSDDYYDSNIFSDLSVIFERDKNIKFVYGNLTFVDINKKIIREEKDTRYDLFDLIHNCADSVRQPCTFFTKSLFDEVGGLDENLKYVFDYDLFIKMLKETKPYYLNRNIAFYREHENTLTKKYLSSQGREIIKVAFKNGANFYNRIILSSLIKKMIFTKIFY